MKMQRVFVAQCRSHGFMPLILRIVKTEKRAQEVFAEHQRDRSCDGLEAYSERDMARCSYCGKGFPMDDLVYASFVRESACHGCYQQLPPDVQARWTEPPPAKPR